MGSEAKKTFLLSEITKSFEPLKKCVVSIFSRPIGTDTNHSRRSIWCNGHFTLLSDVSEKVRKLALCYCEHISGLHHMQTKLILFQCEIFLVEMYYVYLALTLFGQTHLMSFFLSFSGQLDDRSHVISVERAKCELPGTRGMSLTHPLSVQFLLFSHSFREKLIQ